MYTKCKRLKHENNSLKTKLDDLEHVEIQSRMDEVILVENENLKFENTCLVNKVALLELDVEWNHVFFIEITSSTLYSLTMFHLMTLL